MKLLHSTGFRLMILLFLYTSTGAAQYPDSLMHVLKNYRQSDTIKVNLLSDVSLQFQYINIDSMLLLAQQGYSLAENLKYRKEWLNASNYKALPTTTLQIMISLWHFTGEH
jgi:hypothetical protein